MAKLKPLPDTRDIKLLVQMPRELAQQIRDHAAADNRSVNNMIVRMLLDAVRVMPPVPLALPPPLHNMHANAPGLAPADRTKILKFKEEKRRALVTEARLASAKLHQELTGEWPPDIASYCNCKAIRENMGAASPADLIGGHEPDCVATNALLQP